MENTSSYTKEVWNFLERDRTLALVVGVLMALMCPVIVLGNTLIILVVWKNPSRNLRSFTSSYILQSMAVADFLVGSILCPIHSYWLLVTATGVEPVLSLFVPLDLNAILISASVGHVLLLTIDRLMALLAPLQYRVKVTNQLVCNLIFIIWCYALVFGAFHSAFADYFVVSIFYTAQVLIAVSAVICINIVIRCHFLNDSTRNEHAYDAIPFRHFYHQREKNLSQTIALTMGAIVVCFIPWLLIQALLYLCMCYRPNLDSLMKGLAFSSILIYSNSLLNPFVHSWRLARIRYSLKHLLFKTPPRLPRPEPEASPEVFPEPEMLMPGVLMELEEYDTRL